MPATPIIRHDALCLTFTEPLLKVLTQLLSDANINDTGHISINCRDSSYSAERGGFRPQEFGFTVIENIFIPQYVTEFSYVGYPPELVKAMDFDFISGTFQSEYGIVPLENMDELFQLWQQNFVSYFKMGVYKTSITK